MKRNPLECFMFFLLLIVSEGGLTSVRDNLFHENDLSISSTNSNKSPLPIIPSIDYINTPHSCLYISPDLPHCHFIRNENNQRFYRSTDNSFERKRTNEESLFQGHVTVYSLQGCLPSRLPFKMALCESKESLERATKIWKLYPFQVDDHDDNGEQIGSMFVFPRFDISRWSKSMRLLRNERDREQRSNDSESFLKPTQKYFPSSIISFDRDRNDRIKSLSSIVNRNNLTNSKENIKRRRRRRRRRSDRLDRREIRQGSEFPYSKSIPFDPKRFVLNERSSKFLKSSPFLSRKSRDMKMENKFPY
ncbi:uncharacterized protein LOC124954358 isoform X2 [Vespa velutina]|nr:uncharacterized protein LOC124954358 isoform X2 [Vespa velutina]XP_047363139.1 uncharacterized protein LOC124954358 isoform X2 [Vespa velutina]XP_047363140.1 uncharacterized protein LOC124954358 isoform X2 [Vespa velutina]XP_047363141.1 uncharacterized protein LOC124954358 isoform X2 [Vespa velutina]